MTMTMMTTAQEKTSERALELAISAYGRVEGEESAREVLELARRFRNFLSTDDANDPDA